MRLRSFAPMLAIALTGLSGAGMIAAAPAGAAVPTAAHAARSAPAAAPRCTSNRNYKAGRVTFTACNGKTQRFKCSPGNNSSLVRTPLFAANGCEFQVGLWIKKGSTSGTPNLCVNPRSSTDVLKKNYKQFKVLNNKHKCGH